jgi:hypothetical protein
MGAMQLIGKGMVIGRLAAEALSRKSTMTFSGTMVPWGSLREPMRLVNVTTLPPTNAVSQQAVKLPAAVQYPPEAGDRLASFDHAITAATLAPLLGVSQQMIYNRAAGGSLPCFRIGGAVRFCPATIVTTLALPTTYAVTLLTIVKRLAGFGRAMKAPEVAYILGVGEDLIFRQAAAGIIPSFHVGTALLFSHATMARYIASISKGGGANSIP